MKLFERVILKISGMGCAACVQRVESALKSLEGVTDVTVNLATSKAAVIHRLD